MDLAVAIATIAAAVIAVLPRLPGWTADDRRRDRVRRDLELWQALPDGAAKARLRSGIETQTVHLLDERARDTTIDQGWLYGTGWLSAAWILLVASTALTSEAAWAGHVRTALQFAGVCAGAIGLLLMATTVALVAWKAALKLYVRLRSTPKRAEPVGYEI